MNCCHSRLRETRSEVTGKLIDSGAVDLVVIDSVARARPSMRRIDGDMGGSHVIAGSDEPGDAPSVCFYQ